MRPKSANTQKRDVRALFGLLLLLLLLCTLQPQQQNGAHAKVAKLKVMKTLFKAKMFLKPLIKSGAIKAPTLHLVMPLMMRSTLSKLMGATSAENADSSDDFGKNPRIGWPFLKKPGHKRHVAPSNDNRVEWSGRLAKNFNKELHSTAHCYDRIATNKLGHRKRSIDCIRAAQCQPPNPCSLVAQEIDSDLSMNPAQVLQQFDNPSPNNNYLELANEPVILPMVVQQEGPESISEGHNFHPLQPNHYDASRTELDGKHFYQPQPQNQQSQPDAYQPHPSNQPNQQQQQQPDRPNEPSHYYQFNSLGHQNHRKLLEQIKPSSEAVGQLSLTQPLSSTQY